MIIKEVTSKIAYCNPSDAIVKCNCGSNPIAVYFGTSRNYTGVFTIKKVDSGANTVTIYPNGTETIDGAVSVTLTAQNEYKTFVAHDNGFTVIDSSVSTVSFSRNHIFYVDGNRTDGYVEDGSFNYPYKTITAAQDAINVLSAALLDSAAHFELCKFIVNIAPGKYTDNIDITTARYIRYNMEGVEISGDLTITQNQLGLTDYYGKVEFVGGAGNRAYRGNCGLISGDITFLKDAYDSLAYDSFIGVNVTGNVSYGTADASTHGTWVLCLINSYFGNGAKFISAYLTAASEHVLIESYGYNKILSHIAKQDGSATAVTIYDCNDTYFDLINVTPLENGSVKNCTFNSTTSIVASKTLTLDTISYKSLLGQTPTLTNMTIAFHDDYIPAPVYTFYVDGNRTDSYTANGSLARPYKTIAAAQTAINALADAQIALATQVAWDTTRYIVKIAGGIYSDAITITNMKYLRYDMEGVTISGNIAINTTMIGGAVSDYYGRVEFKGMTGTYRVEKGRCALISGNITGTRNNDSLMYLSFNGVQVSGNISIGTAETASEGTWVMSCQNSFFSGTDKFISAYVGASSVILIESSYGTEFKCHLAKQDGSACNIDLYTCDNTQFDLINITPLNACRLTNCVFNSDVSIVAAKNLNIDANSSMSLFAQTETLTGMTIVALDGILKTTATVATRAAARALVGDGVTIGTILIGGAAVGTTKPNVYIKVINTPNDSDWERIVTQASD